MAAVGQAAQHLAWTFTPLEGGRTRLVRRLKEQYNRSSPGLALVTVLIFELGDFPMMRKLLLGVKSRAERTTAAQPGGPAAAQTTTLQS